MSKSHPVVKAVFIIEVIIFYAAIIMLAADTYNLMDKFFELWFILLGFTAIFLVIFVIEATKNIRLCSKKYYIISLLMQIVAGTTALYVWHICVW